VTFGQVSGDSVCIDICVTFMNCILNYAQGELPRKARGELQKYLSCQFRESRIRFEFWSRHLLGRKIVEQKVGGARRWNMPTAGSNRQTDWNGFLKWMAELPVALRNSPLSIPPTADSVEIVGEDEKALPLTFRYRDQVSRLIVTTVDEVTPSSRHNATFSDQDEGGPGRRISPIWIGTIFHDRDHTMAKSFRRGQLRILGDGVKGCCHQLYGTPGLASVASRSGRGQNSIALDGGKLRCQRKRPDWADLQGPDRGEYRSLGLVHRQPWDQGGNTEARDRGVIGGSKNAIHGELGGCAASAQGLTGYG
jgi:hypothetical protein